MALLDRVKERIEADLTDTDIAEILASSLREIEDRFGPTGEPITVELVGGRSSLDLIRPIDTEETVEITVDEEDLEPDDFRIFNGGRTLRTSSGYRFGTGPVSITYTPKDDQPQRDEVAVKLAILDITYRGANKSARAGDTALAGDMSSDAFAKEQESLLGTLAPRRGLFIR